MLRICSMTWSCPRKSKHSTLCLYVKQVQNFSSSEHPSKATNVMPTYFSQSKLWKRVNKKNSIIKDILQSPVARNCVSLLANIMECDETIITELISRDSSLVTSKLVLEKAKLLKDHGFSADDIVATPSILHRSFGFLQNRLQVIKSMPWPDIITLHAINQPDKVFEQFTEKCRNDFKAMEGFASRQQFLANLFQCDEKTMALLLVTNKLLMSVSPALISSKMNTLAKFQITPSYVREHSRILFHTSVKELDRRLTLLNDKQLLPPNSCEYLSYLLSCSKQEFSKSFNYICIRKEALEGCKDELEYVCFRLKCSESMAKYFLSSTHMKRLSEIKLKQMFDFLLKEIRMEADFVIKHRELFIYSIKRLKERWTVLHNAGYRDVTLLPSVVVLTDKQFSTKYGSYVFVDTFNSQY